MLSGITGNIQETINNILDFTKIKSVLCWDETVGVSQSDTLEEAIDKIPENTICIFWVDSNVEYEWAKEVINDTNTPNRGHMLIYKSVYNDQNSNLYVGYLFYLSITYSRIYFRIYDHTTHIQFQDEWKYISLLDI